MADCATRLCVKLCLLRLCFFSGFIFGSIHRNLVKHEFGANSYAAYSLKCWAVWGFLGAWGEEQQCFGSHTIPKSSHFTEFSGNEHMAFENPPLNLGLCQLQWGEEQHKMQASHTYVSSTGRVPSKKAEGVGYFIGEDSTWIWVLNTVIIFLGTICFQNMLQKGLYWSVVHH